MTLDPLKAPLDSECNIPVRMVARMDIKGPNLIKGIKFDGLRILGDPQEKARLYYEQGADELIYIDCVASLYGRDNLADIVARAASEIYIPLTVGGGVRSVEDARRLFRSGADKVAINTAAVERPELITELAQVYGSQAVVLSIEAKRVGQDKWEPYTKGGREKTGLDAVSWAKRAASLGAGEVLITSVDQDGTGKGFDIPLIAAINTSVDVPVIASGGLGNVEHATQLLKEVQVSAFAVGGALHYGKTSVSDIKAALASSGFQTRMPG